MISRRTPRSFCLAIFLCSAVVALAMVAKLSTVAVVAQIELVTPGPNIEIFGVPNIPTKIAREVEPYRGAYGLPLAGWNPKDREIWLKGLSSVAWVSRVR